MISGTTGIIGVLGWPVKHSLSPAMHNAALAHAGLDYAYIPLAVEPGKLKEAVKGLPALGFIGVNVTVPHKEKIMQYLDEIEEQAQKVGAVNTIVIKKGKLHGYNTDIGGFSAALARHHVEVKGKKALIFGAGGAARAIVQALAQSGCTGISVGARSKEKAELFAGEFCDLIEIKGYAWESEGFRKAHWEAGILINTTPVGMDGIDTKSVPVHWTDVPPEAFAADIIYNPPMTAFLRQARLRGCRGMNGLAMLVEQGALSYQLWFGKEPPREIMYETLIQKI